MSSDASISDDGDTKPKAFANKSKKSNPSVGSKADDKTAVSLIKTKASSQRSVLKDERAQVGQVQDEPSGAQNEPTGVQEVQTKTRSFRDALVDGGKIMCQLSQLSGCRKRSNSHARRRRGK